MTRAAMVEAIRTGFRWAITSDEPDTLMTVTTGGVTPTQVLHASTLRPIADSSGYSTARLALDASFGPGTLSFGGGGTLVLEGYDPPPRYAEIALSGPPATIPESASLPTTLAQWNVPGTPHFVRLIVSAVDGPAEWMRICWLFEHPSALRLSCSRHLRSNGALVGADTIHDIGRLLTHRSNEESPAPRRVLECAQRHVYPNGGTTQSAFYRVVTFEYPYLTTNWTSRMPFVEQPGDRGTYTREQLPSGAIRYAYVAPTNGYYMRSVEVRGPIVERVYDVDSDGNGTDTTDCR